MRLLYLKMLKRLHNQSSFFRKAYNFPTSVKVAFKLLPRVIFSFIIIAIFMPSICIAQKNIGGEQIAGEFFGVPVSMGNYYFVKKVVLRIGASWRKVPTTEEELEDLVWQELLFSYEAFRRGIEVSRQEKEAEIEKMLKADKVEFDWKTDKQAYASWVDKQLQESVEIFENQIEHLVKLEKLRQQVIDSLNPDVSRDEAYQKFLDEYTSLGVELIKFEDEELEEAKELYSQVKSKPKLWDKVKEERQDSFRNLIGPYALDFLINLWGFPREDAYKMSKMKEGQFYKPCPIFKGYAVFKILKTREADPKEFQKRQDYYYDKIKMIKKYQGFKDWAQDLKEQANIKVFIE